jgi:hypothetical protein
VEQAMDQIKLYNILRNALKMTEQDAGEFISAVGAITSRELDTKIQALATKDDLRELSLATKDDLRKLSLATKDDILDLNKKIYLIGLVQFIALVTSMLAIVKFMR